MLRLNGACEAEGLPRCLSWYEASAAQSWLQRRSRRDGVRTSGRASVQGAPARRTWAGTRRGMPAGRSLQSTDFLRHPSRYVLPVPGVSLVETGAWSTGYRRLKASLIYAIRLVAGITKGK